ncbi:MAG: S1 RNA-binding domain-containing protein [bacterium]|nr:S1 RNA-binding domain-containing protein [bacterium]
MANLTQKADTQSVMAQLLADNSEIAIPNQGDIITGKVILASKNEVHLDIGGYASGVVRGPELFDESGEYSNLKVGDEATASVVEVENENGEVELSFQQAGHDKAWKSLKELMHGQSVVDAHILDANKGGLIIRVGNVSGFLPVSQLSVEHYPRVEGGNKSRILEKLKDYVSEAFQVKVIDVDEIENKLIVSEKLAKAEQQQQKISQYKVNDVVEGKVTGVVDFGAFIEFGDGLEGLVHISEIAWQRIDNPSDFVSIGQDVKAQIISIDDSKISLSIRNLETDPWQIITKKYNIGDTVEGIVLKVNPFGAFVELDTEIHGLAHISELSYKKLSSPTEVVQEGKTYEFKIISIEPNQHRLGLSYKALHETPKEAPAIEEVAVVEEPKEETVKE